MKEPVTETIKKGGFDNVFPETDFGEQDISVINKKLAIKDTKKELEK